MPSATRHVCDSSLHNVWDGTLTPACEVESGDSIELAVPDASYGQVGRETRSDELLGLDFSLMNPVAGPVFVRGARPGDTLEVEILEVRTDVWGWTGIVPGFGLLADDFPRPWLRISDIDGGVVRYRGRRHSALSAVPRDDRCRSRVDRGRTRSCRPREFGGNLDVRYLTVGATLFLPVGVDGALLSIGDGHAAQGDGEVCGSAIETGMEIAVRVRSVATSASRPRSSSSRGQSRGRGARTSRPASPTTFDRRRRMQCAR